MYEDDLTASFTADLRYGGLPDGTTVSLTGVREFAARQYSHDPVD